MSTASSFPARVQDRRNIPASVSTDCEVSETEPTITRLVNRLRVLRELIRLSMTLSLEDMLQTVVVKATEVLGDCALIVLKSGAKHQPTMTKYQLGAAFCVDADKLNRMLMTAVNISQEAVVSELLGGALDKGEIILIKDLAVVTLD